jgi:hypothetical protein
MEHKKIITILVDNESWILPYAKKLETELELMGIDAKLVRSYGDFWCMGR